MSFPRYPAYTTGPADWLVEIPSTWRVVPLWAMFSRTKRTGYEGEELLSVYRDHGVIPKKSRNDNFNKPSDDLASYQLVEPGDLAINKMKAWQGSVAISGYRGMVSPAYHVYTSRHDEDPRYLHHLFRCMEYIVGYRSNSKGIRVNQWDLEPQQHSRMPVLIPPRTEQIQISRFLDHETAKIDALIQEQQRLIELLKEKRQAVISHAVTKGLDPSVPMKDSGVEWLGEVPKHWKVSRLKFVAAIIDCKNRTPEYFDDGEFLVVRTSNVKEQRLNTEDAYRTNEENFKVWTQRGVPPVGSILFTREAPTGEVCLVPPDFPICLGQRMMNFIPDDSNYIPFLFDFLTSDCLARYIESVSHGSTVTHLRVEQVYDIPVVVPSTLEQEEIDAVVSELKQGFAVLVNEAQITISLLQERRSALISSAVTGKIDVRNWKPSADQHAFDKEVRQAGLETLS